MTKYIHLTKKGERINFEDLTDSHLANIIAYIKRRVKEGVLVKEGGGHSWDIDSMWYEERTLYGKQAKRYLSLDKYKTEQKRRLQSKVIYVDPDTWMNDLPQSDFMDHYPGDSN